MIYSFSNDYSCIAHPLVLKKLVACAEEQNIGYGLDAHTKSAQEKIKNKIKNHQVDIYFLAGGTQVNMTLISGVLRPHEAVISVETGHINVHETGAIEGQGHKVLTAPGKDGKLLPSDVQRIVDAHVDNHMVSPRLVYISNTTEVGTVYTKSEIQALSEVCKRNQLLFYMDGARLASALASPACDYSYEDFPLYLDAFYIGGTKNGGYIGEALVLIKEELKKEFNYIIKHYGAMLAKGFVGAIVFEVLMEGNLYLEIGQQENKCAFYLQEEMRKLGIAFQYPSTSNQIFPVVSKRLAKEIKKKYSFEITGEKDENHWIIRLVTSFDTTIEVCQGFIRYLSSII